jgi:CHAT domain-containing protein
MGEPVIQFADSALYLSDLIAGNHPQTRLVVLSGYETGNGKLFRGEGVFSFSRGFASLGVPTAITNLWSVDDEPTYRITELFYHYLAEGLPEDIALQKAKLRFFDHASAAYKLPFYGPPLLLRAKPRCLFSAGKLGGPGKS